MYISAGLPERGLSKGRGRERSLERLTVPHIAGYPARKESVDADGARAEFTAKGTGEA